MFGAFSGPDPDALHFFYFIAGAFSFVMITRSRQEQELQSCPKLSYRARWRTKRRMITIHHTPTVSYGAIIALFVASASIFPQSVADEPAAAVVVPNTDNIEECNVPTLSDIAGIDAQQSCIKHDGITRCWYTYVPDSIKSSSDPPPLVLDLHGYNLCASQSARYTGWNRIADQHGFVVVWPQGNLNAEYSNDPSWDFGSCCSSIGAPSSEGEWPPPADIDDVDFLRQVVANVASEIMVDTRRVYLAGHSNGCMMAQAMAALQSDLVAAVCCHASSLMVPPAEDYTATSVQVTYGDLDSTISMFFGSNSHILETWGDINQCKTNTSTVADSGLYTTHTLSNCTGDTIVETTEVYNAGHFPYLGIPPDNEFTVAEYPGAVTPEVDTTLLSWAFCSKYASDLDPVLPAAAAIVPADQYGSSTNMPTISPSVKDGEETSPSPSATASTSSAIEIPSGLFTSLVGGLHALIFTLG